MSETFHVFYRTQGMASRNQPGWLRSDFIADTAEDALAQLMRVKRLLHARVYAGAACHSIEVRWSPEVMVKHEPHPVGEQVDQ